MKELYSFFINKEVEVEETEVSKNESGEEIKTIKKVKKNEPVRVIVKKPTRNLFDEAELFYGVTLSEGIKSGLLTRALLAKRINNDGGVFSDEEQVEYSGSYVKLFELQNEFQKISMVDKDKRTEEEQAQLKLLMQDIENVREKIQNFEIAQSSLFEQTAENRARNKTIIWWLLNLSYIEENGSPKSLFGEGSYRERLEVYDDIEEKDLEFEKKAIQKLVYLISFWYMGRASIKEEFDNLLRVISPVKEEPAIEKH